MNVIKVSVINVMIKIGNDEQMLRETLTTMKKNKNEILRKLFYLTHTRLRFSGGNHKKFSHKSDSRCHLDIKF